MIRDERINHIISECSESAQREFMTRYTWVAKVINWELCKKFKFDHEHNPESLLENETPKILQDFEIQICRRELRFLVGPPKAYWSGTQRY